ncbi:MAG: helix-turn-helix domain-containing protein [Promethearchaeota archaeon]
MEKIKSVINTYLKPETKVIYIAIIERDDNIVYSTDNWDISDDLKHINETWGFKHAKDIIVLGERYSIIQNTSERIVAVKFVKKRNGKITTKESILGFKDDNRKILCKVPHDEAMDIILVQLSRVIRSMSSREPYLKPDAPLGKVAKLKWATPKILLDDTQNLQRIGLLKVGLSLDEAKVYLALLNKGEKGEKVGILDKGLDLKRTHIYRIIERLIRKDWVQKVSETPTGRKVFAARPLNNLMDEIIQNKEEELKILKSFRFIMGESLENGWIDVSEITKDLQPYSKKAFDFNTLGITGVEKDCGLLIFEYDKIIEEQIVIQAALQLSFEKIRETIQPNLDHNEYTIPDLEEIKIIDTKIKDYLGMIMYFKFKEGTTTANNVGTDWIIAAKHVAVPIDDKIYVVWGSEEKFPLLLSIILKLK